MILNEKQLTILRLKKEGYYNNEIGKMMSLSTSRVHALSVQATWATSVGNEWCYGLRTKTSNLLMDYLLTQEECKDFSEWDSGWIKDYLWQQKSEGLFGKKTKGFGDATVAEIMLWVER